jgi:hypothetical protein
MSRDASPVRVSAPRSDPVARKFTRRVIQKQVEELFEGFDRWSDMTVKITENPDFAIGHDLVGVTFDECVKKIAMECWHEQIKVPATGVLLDTFILLCCTLDTEEVGYNFHVSFYYFMVKYVGVPINWWYIRYRTLKIRGDRFPSALFSFLEILPPPEVGQVLSQKYVNQLGKAVRAWGKRKTPPDTLYDQVWKAIDANIRTAVNYLRISAERLPLEHFTDVSLQQYCYDNELYLAELPLWHVAALLFMTSSYSFKISEIRTMVMELALNGKITKDDYPLFLAKLVELKLNDSEIQGRLRHHFAPSSE